VAAGQVGCLRGEAAYLIRVGGGLGLRVGAVGTDGIGGEKNVIADRCELRRSPVGASNFAVAGPHHKLGTGIQMCVVPRAWIKQLPPLCPEARFRDDAGYALQPMSEI